MEEDGLLQIVMPDGKILNARSKSIRLHALYDLVNATTAQDDHEKLYSMEYPDDVNFQSFDDWEEDENQWPQEYAYVNDGRGFVRRVRDGVPYGQRNNNKWRDAGEMYITVDGKVTSRNSPDKLIEYPSTVSVGYGSPLRMTWLSGIVGHSSGLNPFDSAIGHAGGRVKPRAVPRAVPRAPTKWMLLVRDVHSRRKARNPLATYKDSLVEASKEYRRRGM